MQLLGTACIEATMTALKSKFIWLDIEPMDETCLYHYHEALKKAQGEKGEYVHFRTINCPCIFALIGA